VEQENNRPDLQLRGLVKTFDKVIALDNVDVSVEHGQLLTILGPSGSGKTTLLKVVAGFEYPEGGQVVLTDKDITSLPPGKRNIGMVFQNYALFPHMTVAQNIAFPLQMRSTPTREIRERVESVLQTVELAGYQDRLPRQLSGGQQQRVALARAIVFNPRLLLLDEPFGALDRKLRETMQLELRRLQRRLGLTTLFVTHDQEEALILSDQVAVMNAGRIEQMGSPEEIYTQPASLFVADFIGESNLLKGTVKSVQGECCTVALQGGLIMAVRNQLDSRPGDPIGLSIRPEAAQRLGNPAESDNGFTVEVVESVYLGQAYKYRLRLNAMVELIVRWPATAGATPLALGERLSVGWPSETIRVMPVKG
jgi:putative spermidine/putrescine transport system ATP-binding protein